MGLDTVELVVAVEDCFGIEITDGDAEQVFTVGSLYQLVLALLASKADYHCKTQHVFYRLRRNLPMWQQSTFTPTTPLSLVFERKTIQAQRAALQRDIGLRLPDLHPPDWVTYLSICLVVAFSVLLFTGLHSAVRSFEVLLVGVWLVRFLSFMADRLANDFRLLTVRDLVVSTTALNHARIHPGFHSNPEVYDILVQLIVDQLGVDRSEVYPTARFREDLGIE